MYTRHEDVPVYEYRRGQLDASIYNAVRVSFKRLNTELRLPLKGLKTLDLILQNDAWIVVDRAFNDVPIIAWTHFKREGESGLHNPVACEVRLFHANAGMLLQRIIGELEPTLRQQMHEDGTHQVLTFPTKD